MAVACGGGGGGGGGGVSGVGFGGGVAVGGGGASIRGELLEPAAIIETFSAARIDALTSASKIQSITGKARCEVRMLRLNYRTIGVKGEWTNATGALLMPLGPACDGAATLLAYSKGTDVVQQRTFANANDVETQFLISMYAAQGYAVVASDMLGFAGSGYGFHPYLHADSEASATIDALRAARHAMRAAGGALNGKVMATGYSQGGHTSMATQRAIERDLAAEFNFVAGAHLAGPYNLSATVRGDLAIAGSQVTLPYMITSYQKTYGDLYREPSDVFKSPYAGYVQDLLPSKTHTLATLITSGLLPAGTPEAVKSALLRDEFRADYRSNPQNGLYRAAGHNDLLDWTPRAPMLLCGGAGDPTVPLAVHQAPAEAAFKARGAVNVTSVDVDPQIQAAFGVNGKTPDSADPTFAAYMGAYHSQYEGTFCHALARRHLDGLNR